MRGSWVRVKEEVSEKNASTCEECGKETTLYKFNLCESCYGKLFEGGKQVCGS